MTGRLVGWRFVLSPRWLGYAAFSVAFAVVCVLLSHWQASRSAWAAEKNAQTAENFHAVPRPLGEVLTSLSDWREQSEWLRVEVTGTFDRENQLFVRNRPLHSTPGFEVLTPLRLSDGSVFIVDRGWVGTTSNVNYPVEAADPPAGEVTVVVRLRPAEPRFGTASTIRNQIQTVDLEEVRQRIGGRAFTGAYGLLDRYVAPAHTSELATVQPGMPLENQGMYLSYMIQWIVFALIGFFALGYGIRTEFRRLNEDDPRERTRDAERRRRRSLRPLDDAQNEDAILDAGEGVKPRR
jgi:cytochrome oxidase assembly protein ShyY1